MRATMPGPRKAMMPPAGPATYHSRRRAMKPLIRASPARSSTPTTAGRRKALAGPDDPVVRDILREAFHVRQLGRGGPAGRAHPELCRRDQQPAGHRPSTAQAPHAPDSPGPPRASHSGHAPVSTRRPAGPAPAAARQRHWRRASRSRRTTMTAGAARSRARSGSMASPERDAPPPVTCPEAYSRRSARHEDCGAGEAQGFAASTETRAMPGAAPRRRHPADRRRHDTAAQRAGCGVSALPAIPSADRHSEQIRAQERLRNHCRSGSAGRPSGHLEPCRDGPSDRSAGVSSDRRPNRGVPR